MNKKAAPGEQQILRTIRRLTGLPTKKSGIRVGIGDDCAVLTPRPGEELVITTDFSIQDRHFRLDWHPPEAIGHKCLARGLSDIAAMGARPIAAFVSLALPRALSVPEAEGKKSKSWIDRFYTGLLALADREGVALAGGDLSESPAAALADIIVIGAAPKGRALLRSTARVGDILYVTGTLGGAAAELARLEQSASKPRRTRSVSGFLEAFNSSDLLKARDSGDHPHFYPQPRLSAGQALLRRHLATSCIDISDGLSTDLLHLCDESSLDAELDANAIPVHPDATLEQALHGGDDYELLFTVSPRAAIPKSLTGIPIHAIGRMLKQHKRSPGINLITQSGSRTRHQRLKPQGWQHF